MRGVATNVASGEWAWLGNQSKQTRGEFCLCDNILLISYCVSGEVR